MLDIDKERNNMKGKVITVNEMGDFYIIEEMNYQNKKYVLCKSLDEENPSDTKIELSLFEVTIKENELKLENVEDETAQTITSMIMEKIQNNN